MVGKGLQGPLTLLRLLVLLCALVPTLVVGYYQEERCRSDADCNDLRRSNCGDISRWSSYGHCQHVYCDEDNVTSSNQCGSSLLHCDGEVTGGLCLPTSCSSDENCTNTNTFCRLDQAYCDCSSGYSEWNGECAPVIERGCLANKDCNNGREDLYQCRDQICRCEKQKWYELAGQCVSYYGQTCSSRADCGVQSNTTCDTDLQQCVCKEGFEFHDGICHSFYRNQCNSTEECGTLAGLQCIDYSQRDDYNWWDYNRNDAHYSYSDWLENDQHGKCRCSEGYTFNGNICQKVVGSSCNQVTCGNSTHWSYSQDDIHFYDSNADYHDYHDFGHPFYGDYGFWTEDFYSYYRRYHSAYYCNVENICSCSEGYQLSTDGLHCEAVLGQSCQADTDCSGTNGMFQCVMNTCVCGDNFIPTHNITYDGEIFYEYYSYNAEIETICQPRIGLQCENGCDITGAECNNATGYCVCVNGTHDNGNCVLVLGDTCERDGPCELVPGAHCGAQGTCSCREGYSQRDSQDVCEPVLGLACSTDTDCTGVLSGTVCTESACACTDDLQEYEGRCLSASCAVPVPYLPDIYRRSPSYKVTLQEPALRDDQLIEQWYNLGKHMLADASSDPGVGYCGTKYPVYLSEKLSADDMASLEGGAEVSKVAVVSYWAINNNQPVSFRKCGDDLQVKLSPLPVAFAAYCVDSGISSNPARNTSQRWAIVKQQLDFYPDGTDDNGTLIYQPHVYFECQAIDAEHAVYNHYSAPDVYHQDDGYFYTVSWYINNKLYTSSTPKKRHDLDSTNLDERQLQADYPILGYKVRCAYEWSETLFGRHSSPVFSPEEPTGFQALHFSSINTDGHTLQIKAATPLGCRGPIDDDNYETIETCSITWDIAESEFCSRGTDEQHPLCGITLRGRGPSDYDNHYQYTNTYFENGTRYRKYEYFYTNIVIPETFDHEVTNTFRAQFGPSSSAAEHTIWDGYVLPDFTFVVDDGRNSSSGYCDISMGHLPTVNNSKSDGHVEIDTEGTILLMRSRSFPIEVQIQTESCDESINGICVCGVTFRNGDNIYTLSLCDDMYLEGNLDGDSVFPDERTGSYSFSRYIHVANQQDSVRKVMLVNGMTADIYIDSGSGIVTIQLSDYRGSESLFDTDGLCMFESGRFHHKSGAVTTSDDGFIDSWVLAEEESLFNPENHINFAWAENYYQCHCPSANETIEERKLTYSYQGSSRISENYDVYTGMLVCTLDTVCSTPHEGLEWTGTVLPDFSITTVTMQPSYITLDGAPMLAFTCDFDAKNEYKYSITWYANEFAVSSKDLVSMATDNFNVMPLSDVQIQTPFFDANYVLNIEWQCSVSVHDVAGSVLIPPVYSDVFNAVEFESTTVVLARGGQTSLDFKVNMPLLCHDGNLCYLEFLVYDEDDDYTCQDSTVAIKNPYTCGERVMGATRPEDIKHQSEVKVSITTKNNNKYTLKNAFNLKIQVKVVGQLNSILSGTFAERFTVIVRDEDNYWKNTYCYATNDPRVRTFDGQYYSVISSSLIDEFVLMRHKDLPVEVQMQTELCNWGWAACGCGATIRAGKDVFTITHCHDDHLVETLANGDGILEVRRRSPNRYQVYFPHGTMVEVYYYRSKWWSTMNIMIYPSPEDMGRLEGLCGNFNADRSDDMLHSDGVTMTNSPAYYWWWWWEDPDDFSRSWGLYSTGKEHTSLLNMEYIENELSPWHSTDIKCVCPLTNGYRFPMCSANEDQTCVTENGGLMSKPGDYVQMFMRGRRSTQGKRDIEDIKQRLERIRTIRSAEFEDLAHLRSKRETEGTEGTNPDACTYEEAWDICEEGLTSDCSTKSLEGNLPNGTNITSMIEDCAKDVMINKSQNWFDSSCSVMQGVTEVVVQKDVEFQEENPNITETITKATCVGSCSFHGTCTADGTCDCDEGFGNIDCSIDLRPPDIKESSQTLCNKSQSDCEDIRFTTDGCVPTSTCRVVHTQLQSDGSTVVSGVQTVSGSCDNGYDMYCPVTTAPNARRRRSMSDSQTLADLYSISLSNDASQYGLSVKVVSIDTTCIDYDPANDTATLMPDFCLIGGRCYGNGTRSDSDPCQYCHDTADRYYWTQDKVTELCKDKDDDDDEKHGGEGGGGKRGVSVVIIGAAVGGLVIVVVGSIAAYCIYKAMQKKKLRRARVEAGLYDCAMNKTFRKVRVAPASSVPWVEPYQP